MADLLMTHFYEKNPEVFPRGFHFCFTPGDLPSARALNPWNLSASLGRGRKKTKKAKKLPNLNVLCLKSCHN